MAEFIGYSLGILAVAFLYLAFVAVRLTVWAGLFWFGAWLFPALEALTQNHLGVSMATVGAGVGLLSLANQPPTVTVKGK